MKSLFFCVIFWSWAAPLSALDLTAQDYPAATRLTLNAPGEFNVAFLPDSNALQIEPQINNLEINLDSHRLKRVDGRSFLKIDCDCRLIGSTLSSDEPVWIVNNGLVTEGAFSLSFAAIASPTRTAISKPKSSLGFTLAKKKPTSDLLSKMASAVIPPMNLDISVEPRNSANTRLLSKLEQAVEIASKPASNDLKTTPQLRLRSRTTTQNRASTELASMAQELSQSCAPFERFDVTSWPDTGAALDVIKAIFLEMGDLGEGLKLDRLGDLQIAYLSLGMGAEAAATTPMLDTMPKDTKVLQTISNLVDSDPIADPWLTANNCDSLAIWKALVGAGDGSEIVQLARQQFANAPNGLKSAIGTRLANQFLDNSHNDAANFVVNSSENQPEQRTGERALLASRLAELSGSSRQSEEALVSAIDLDSDEAPNALLALVEDALENGAPLAQKEKEMVVAYKEELLGSGEEIALMRAEIKSEINDSGYARALSLLPAYVDLARATQVDLILDELAARILDEPSDAEFLVASLDLPKSYRMRVSRSIAVGIAARFAKLGLANLAADYSDASNQTRVLAQAPEPIGEPSDLSAEEELGERPQAAPVEPANATSVRSVEVDAPTTPQKLSSAVMKSEEMLTDLENLMSDLSEFGL